MRSAAPVKKTWIIEWSGILLWTVVSGLLVSSLYSIHHALPWDAGASNIDFITVLRSLNFYGEPLFWAPHLNLGIPVYLSMTISAPAFFGALFLPMELFLRLTGALGIHFDFGPNWYIFYFLYYMPFFYLTGVYYLSKLFFRDTRVLIYILIAAAFSPPRMHSFMDVFCLEPTVWGIFLTLALIHFYRSQSQTAFWGLALSLLGFATCFSFPYLFFNIFFFPAFLFVVIAYPREQREAIGRLVRNHWKGWLFLAVLLLIAIIPQILFTQEYRGMAIMNNGGYNLEQIKAGNPLELFTTHIPGLQLNWTQDYHSNVFINNLGFGMMKDEIYVSFLYLGLLNLPLAILGLLRGQSPLRTQLITLLIVFHAIFVLAALSPFLSFFYYPDHSPLRTVNHLADSILKLGGCLPLLLAAGLGLEALLKDPQGLRRTFFFSWLAMSAITLSIFAAFLGRDMFTDTRACLWMLCSFLFAILWILYCYHPAGIQEKRHLIILILFLVLIDTGTQTLISMRQLFHVRDWHQTMPRWTENQSWKPTDGVHQRSGYFSLGLNPAPLNELRLKRIPMGQLPETYLYEKVLLTHGMPSPAQWAKANNTLLLEASSLNDQQRAVFERLNQISAPPKAKRGLRATWNSFNRLTIEVFTPVEAALFIRDSFWPHWHAKVNGKNQALARAFHAFMALPVPAGPSTVEMTFRPTALIAAVTLNRILIAFVLGMIFWSRRQKYRIRSAPA